MNASSQQLSSTLVDDDGSSHPLVMFMDRVERLQDTIARRARSYELLQLEPGSIVADIGCGAGTAAFEMEERVRPDGSVVGIDISEDMLKAGRARAARRASLVQLQNGDASALPFPDGHLHAYRAERLFQHLREPEKFLKEAHRVLAPGGRIVLIDQDWDGVLVDSNDLVATRAIARLVGGGIANSAAGRQYYRLLKDAGFDRVQVFADTHVATSYEEYGFFPELWAQVGEASGVLTSETADAWIKDQRNRGEQGRFFMAMTHFIALAYR